MKIAILLLFISLSSLYAKETKFLSIHSYNDTYPWTKNQYDGFREAISTDPKIHPIYSSEYMDTKRKMIDENYEKRFLSYLEEKYNHYSPEIIYVTDDNALNFITKYIHNIFPDAQIIFSGINSRSSLTQGLQNSYSGLFEEKKVLPNLELIQKLFPNEKDILLIGDGSITAHSIHEKIISDTSNNNIHFTQINLNDFKTALRKIEEFNGKIAILSTVGGFHSDTKQLIELDQVLQSIVNTGLITFAMEDIYIKHGIVGGYVVDGFQTGYEAAKIALQLLNQPTTKVNTSAINPYKWIFDTQALQKYNISLPQEIKLLSLLLNKPKSFYQKNEQLITNLIFILVLIIVLGITIFVYYLFQSRKILSKRQKELENVTTNLNKAQQIAMLGSWEWNVVQDTLWWSDQIYRIFGLQPQEFKANYEAFLEHVHPADRIKVQDAVNVSLDSGELYSLEHRIIKKDGTICHVVEEGTVIYKDNEPYKMIGTIHDITNEKNIKEALEKSERQYRTLVENSMVGIIKTKISGEIVYLNNALIKILSFNTADELIGQNISTMYTYHEQREKFLTALNKKHQINNYELEINNKYSEPIPIMISATLEDNMISAIIIDITEIKKSRLEIDKLSKAIEQTNDSVLITDVNGMVKYVNKSFCELTGFSKSEVLDKTLNFLKSGEHGNEFYENLWNTILKGNVFKDIVTNKKKNGELYYEKKHISPLKNEYDEIIGFISTGHDVTQETIINKKTEHLASMDQLTDIYNRHKFQELFNLELEKVHRFSDPLCMIIVDIDFFKSFNDTYGHDIGDKVLIEVANTLKSTLRKIDILSRWGGEEFLILCPHTDLQNAKKIAEKLRIECEKISIEEVKNSSISISLGVSEFQNNDTLNSMFKRADEGLYMAKKNGRNQVGIFLEY